MNKIIVTELRTFLSIVFILFCSSLLTISGQENNGMVKYTPDFRFTDGIYLNFDQVKLNRPIPKAKLLTSLDYNDREFFKKIMAMDKIYFYDNMGIRQEIERNNDIIILPMDTIIPTILPMDTVIIIIHIIALIILHITRLTGKII